MFLAAIICRTTNFATLGTYLINLWKIWNGVMGVLSEDWENVLEIASDALLLGLRIPMGKLIEFYEYASEAIN